MTKPALPLNALLLGDPATAAAVIRPLLVVLVIGGTLFGIFGGSDSTELASLIVLLVTSVICGRVFELRRDANVPLFFDPARIWALISLGFFFLALDEAFSIHERIDGLIHAILAIEETAITDRIDDLIILLYGVVGAFLIYLHRGEFRGLGRFYKYLAVGFAFLCLQVAFDVLTNRGDILRYLGIAHLFAIGKIAEEVSKLLAEAAFLLGFLWVYRKVHDERAHRPHPLDAPPASG